MEEYFVGPGETSPFTSLTSDLAFKKAFDPDKPESKINLINLLNDLLGPQLPYVIKDVFRRGSEQNATGSRESKTTVFDLHCTDNAGNFVEIEVQVRPFTNFLRRLAFYAGQMVVSQGVPGSEWEYDVKPTYILAIARGRVFDDERKVHRGAIRDQETNELLMDSYNFTIVELSKVDKTLPPDADNARKWLFAFRYLSSLKRLPPALDADKFRHLTSVAQISNLKGEELKEYLDEMHTEWDKNVERAYFLQHNPDFLKKYSEEVLAEERKKHEAELSALEADNAALEADKSALEARIKALETQLAAQGK